MATEIAEKEVTLYFTDTLRLTRADELNFHLHELRIVKSHANRFQTESQENEKWVFVGYYSKVELAAQKAIELLASNEIASGEVKNLEDYINTIGLIKDQLIKTVSDLAIQLDDFPREKKKSGRYTNKED